VACHVLPCRRSAVKLLIDREKVTTLDFARYYCIILVARADDDDAPTPHHTELHHTFCLLPATANLLLLHQARHSYPITTGPPTSFRSLLLI